MGEKTGTIISNYKMTTISGTQKDMIESILTYRSRSAFLTPDIEAIKSIGWTEEEINTMREEYRQAKRLRSHTE